MNEHNPKHPEQTSRLGEDVFKILRLLSLKKDFSQRDISGHINISLGKTNYLLKALAKKGFVKIKNFISKDQKIKKVRYILTHKGLEQQAHLTHYYLKIKEKEYLDLKTEAGKIANNCT